MPPWVPATSESTWRRVVAGLGEAGVHLEQIDAEAVAFYALCVDGARDAAIAKDARLVARFCRDAIAWGNLIGAQPAARARLGLKPPTQLDADDPWASL